MYQKIGRLYPDGENSRVLIIRDGVGQIGTMSLDDVRALLAGEVPQEISPNGSSDLSVSSRGMKIKIPVDGILYVAIVSQVVNMLDKWPRRKSALWLPEE